MLKAVGSWVSFAVSKQLCELILLLRIEGVPTSESRRAGQPPRILTPEEQEKMRVVCKVCPISAYLRSDRTGP